MDFSGLLSAIRFFPASLSFWDLQGNLWVKSVVNSPVQSEMPSHNSLSLSLIGGSAPVPPRFFRNERNIWIFCFADRTQLHIALLVRYLTAVKLSIQGGNEGSINVDYEGHGWSNTFSPSRMRFGVHAFLFGPLTSNSIG